MARGKFDSEAFSQGDIMRRLRHLEKEIAQLRTARNLQAAAVGEGGMRIHDGGGLRVHEGGDIIIDDNGDLRIRGGGNISINGGGNIEIGDGGDIVVGNGGGITVQGGDGQGDVFRVNSDPPELHLRQDLLAPLAVQIFADRVYTDTVTPLESTDSDTYGDLATVGPTVSGVEVSDAGKVQVTVSASLNAVPDVGPSMSFEVSGATNLSAPVAANMTVLTTNESTAAGVSYVAVVTGLNAGTHQFQAKYRSGQDGTLVTIGQRVLSVVAF